VARTSVGTAEIDIEFYMSGGQLGA
jgi:hypothetical protein